MTEFEKVTTRGGDRGDASLTSGERRRKDDLLFEAMGDVDELSSALGIARAAFLALAPRPAESKPADAAAFTRAAAFTDAASNLEHIQRDLIAIGAQISTPVTDPRYPSFRYVGDADVERLERLESEMLERCTIGDEFVLPGETPGSAAVDLARAICRRAERRVVSCIRDRAMIELAPAQRYLNRLSDLLFILARYVEPLERDAAGAR